MLCRVFGRSLRDTTDAFTAHEQSSECRHEANIIILYTDLLVWQQDMRAVWQSLQIRVRVTVVFVAPLADSHMSMCTG
jgi:hypothetical protein